MLAGHAARWILMWSLVCSLARGGVAQRVFRTFDSWLLWGTLAVLLVAHTGGNNAEWWKKTSFVVGFSELLALPLVDALDTKYRSITARVAAPLISLYFAYCAWQATVDEGYLAGFRDKEGEFAAVEVAWGGFRRRLVWVDVMVSCYWQLAMLTARLAFVSLIHPSLMAFMRIRLHEETVGRAHGEGLLLAQRVLQERDASRAAAAPTPAQVVPA